MDELYVIKGGIIVRTDTGEEFETMHQIAEHMNWLRGRTSFTARKDNDGNEYVDFVGFYADYYDLAELCELCNCLWDARMNNEFCDKLFEKHMEIKKSKERKHKAPYYWNGRYITDHTARKGFWLEDWVTGRKFYFHIGAHIRHIVGLLNDYTENGRYVAYHGGVGNVIEDTSNNEVYVLGDSKHICELRDWLNHYDYERYGERELPYKRMMM